MFHRKMVPKDYSSIPHQSPNDSPQEQKRWRVLIKYRSGICKHEMQQLNSSRGKRKDMSEKKGRMKDEVHKYMYSYFEKEVSCIQRFGSKICKNAVYKKYVLLSHPTDVNVC